MIEGAVSKYGNGSYEKVMEELNLSSEDLGLSRWSYTDAYNTGYDFGQDMEADIGDFFSGGFGGLGEQYSLDDLTGGIGSIPEIGNIADNTGGTKGALEDALDITSENLKYLRDIAEQEAINRFTTAEIHVDMGGVTNTVNQNADLDGVIDYMVTGVQEAMERVAEGVHD
jgi:hypothetical protein